ncbi:MAG: hypothetical protein EXS09_00025 [Gemmataceae bacterium]|nr:hypothetical protein [Gemmataceae bacterium]
MVVLRLALSTLICVAPLAIGHAADAVDPQLHRDLLAGWAELERIDNSQSAIDVSSVGSEQQGAEKANSSSGVFRYRRNRDSARISVDSNKNDESVRNSRYIFLVSRVSDTHPWTMRFVELDLASPNAKNLENGTFLTRIVSPSAVVFLGPIPKDQHRKPSSLAEDPRFKISKLERLPDGLVKVRYKHDLSEGELDCDPAENFVIRRGRARYAPPGISHELTYVKHIGPGGAGGRNTVERIEYDVVTSLGYKRKDVSTYSYPDVRKTGELDEERFRLTAYGLPEPEGIVWKKPRRWLPYWLAGAGALIILVTTLVIRRARRTHSLEKKA